jgi:hypothetical protein
MKVGTVVGVRDGLGIVEEAMVVEDRGDLGPGGEQIVRVRFEVEEGEEDFETECRVSELTEPPTESYGDQWWRVTAAARAEWRKERRARKAAAV